MVGDITRIITTGVMAARTITTRIIIVTVTAAGKRHQGDFGWGVTSHPTTAQTRPPQASMLARKIEPRNSWRINNRRDRWLCWGGANTKGLRDDCRVGLLLSCAASFDVAAQSFGVFTEQAPKVLLSGYPPTNGTGPAIVAISGQQEDHGDMEAYAGNATQISSGELTEWPCPGD